MAHPLRPLLALLPVTMWSLALAAQVPANWSQCRVDSLVPWSCARYYTGAVTMTSEPKAAGTDDRRSVIATVTAGAVSCRVKTSEAPEFTAPGMLVVAPEGTDRAGGYEVNVWCPEAAGERSVKADASTIAILDQGTADYALLDGKDSYEHPDADAVNGVTGSVTVTWHLGRS